MHSRNGWVGKHLSAPFSSDFEGGAGAASAIGARPTLELVPHDASSSTSPTLSDELIAAWRANASCIECGGHVATPGEAALLVATRRVAHAAACFLPALLRGHPTLSRLSERARAKARVKEVVTRRDDETTDA